MALAAALAGGGVLWSRTHPPATVVIAQAARPVPAGARLTRADVRPWRVLAPAPPGALTPAQVHGQRVAVALVRGAPVMAGDLGGHVQGLKAGEVRLVLPVSPAQSALVHAGSRVEILGLQGSYNGPHTTSVLATDVRVIGVYQSNGAPLPANPSTAGSAASDAPALVAVAATPPVLNAVGPYLSATANGASFWLVAEPPVR
ncbi:MAG: hypothetical protein OWV35_13315 [Firmicutes bacterium]|nr:hypothetical protein [Bacillota bacterium]